MGIEDRLPGADNFDSGSHEEGGREQEKPKEIEDANNFDELYETLREKGEIIGSPSKKHPDGTPYKAEDLISAIQNIRTRLIDKAVRESDLPAHLIVDGVFEGIDLKTAFTRKQHLRETVLRLFKDYTEDAVKKDALDLLKFREEEVGKRGDSLANPEL